MFWKNNVSSPFDTILAKEDVTLQEIMDEDEILNECKVQNKVLIDFLIKPDILQELVTLTTTEPGIEVDELSRFKYPNIACELLTCDIPLLNERLAGDKALLAKLYTFLDKEPPLNPLLASFFSKIMAVLIAKRPEQNWLSYQFTCLQVLDFLKAKDNFVALLLKHLGTSAIMDLTLKLMAQVGEVQTRQNILNYLDSQRIIQSLISLLDPKVDSGRHYNVAQLLCDFLQLARDNQRNGTDVNDSNPLLNTLESQETVALLLDHILGEEKCETAIVGGIQILLELLDVNRSSIPKFEFPNNYDANYDDSNETDSKQRVIESTTKVILKRLKDFHKLLINPPKKDSIVTTVGTLNPPLGNTRLQVTKLMAAVINCGGPEVCQELVSLGTMSVLLDLFFAFPWNNFLHAQVQACIAAALNSPPPIEQGDNTIALSKHLLVECKLIDRILDAWKDNDEKQLLTKGVRQGYMGHLINIANNVVNLCSDGPLGMMLKDNLPEAAESLQKFKEGTLAETNNKQDTLLGGVNPYTSNDDTDDYNIPFQQNEQQQHFNEYQLQQLAPNFYNSFAYNFDDFKDGDDTLQSIEHRSGMNFDLSEGDPVDQQELFKQVCAQNINTLDDAEDQIFEDREHTLQTVIEKDTGRNSDSDDDGSPKDDPLMDVEPWSSPNKASEAPSMLTDPWSNSLDENEANMAGWADFSSAVFANSSSDFDKSQEENKPPIEADLTVENIEIVEANDTPKLDSIEIAQKDEQMDKKDNPEEPQKKEPTVELEKEKTGLTEVPVTVKEAEPNKEGV